uniref:protein mono-ADP-ribosyltransferase PARP4 n=1 Tax=Panthera onca TaxID=9690 RepID=UPI002952EFF6|nr:protein mono-ADP-ribosyltransferase PARP4 [Panthera onca]
MTVGIFANCTFCLKVKHLPRQQKKKLQNDIKENGGKFSFLLNPQCTHIILDNADVLSQYQLNSIRKNHIHITNPDFIWESIKERRLLDVTNYDPHKSPDITPPPCQKASSSEMTTDDLSQDNSTEKENVVELTESYTENAEIPHFPQDFEVAKYNTLEKVGAEGGKAVAVVELQCSREEPGDAAFLISAHFLSATGVKTRRHFSVKKTSADASEHYENYIEELKKQGFLLREYFTPEATQLASEKLQALLLEEVMNSSTLSKEVSDLVEMVWAEALGHLEHTLLKPANRISLNDVSKAEGVLLLVKAALKNGETEEQLQNMMTEFYRLIPHRGTATEEVNLRLLAKKEDLCQLIRDMVNVCETNLSRPNPPSLAKYRALRCKIEHVEQNTEEFFRVRKEVLQNNHSTGPVDILQIFRVGRVNEATEFLSQLGNVKPLLHGSPVQSFVGILSRGLLLPKVVEDRGTKRTDTGNLGSGIYFSDSLSTGIKYSHPGETDGTRLLAVCDVALGKCADLHRKDFSLSEAPPGYDSVHGVRATATVTTDFEDDEFVVYKTNQIKLKYIIKFCLPGDEIKDFHPCNTTELEESRPEFSNFSKVEDYQLQDAKPFGNITSGLQDFSGNSVPLEEVHIKGRIIDFVAQVIVFQTYTNQSSVPIEAKYIFPLDDKAAVCGFEAFINGKHIVGEVKEKEAARREYREAISQGHGAYLMDQDAPDVFTVSVGNLPPKAKVLIKITYIMELSIQGTRAVFFMPATVAPWQQDRALNENSQDTVEKIYVKEIGTKQSFSLCMSIEMPYVIEFISSDTHELRQKVSKSLVYSLRALILIEDQMTRLHSPSCHSVSVKWQQLSADAPEPLQAPAQVQSLFLNHRLLVYGFIPHCTQATLCALIQEKEFSTMVSTTELQKTTGTMIHKLTARALIRDYEDGILHENETNHEMKKQMLKSLIIKLSKENSLITQFTSFVAVEKRDGKEAPSPNIPNIMELIAKEDVDFLPYMSWQEEQPDASVVQPLAAFSARNEELRHHLTNRKLGSPELEVFEDFEKGCFSSPLSEKSLTLNFAWEDVEMPLDLSQMDSFKQTGTEPLCRSDPFLKQGACSISAAQRLACLEVEPVIGSRLHCPSHLHRSKVCLASPASSEQPGPSENDQDLQTDSCSDSSLESSTAFRLSVLPLSSFACVPYSGDSCNFGQVDLPYSYQGHKTDNCASNSLELDSPPQPNTFFSPPRVPSSGLSREFDFHYPSGSPLYFQNSSVHSSTAYKPQIDLFANTELEASSANVCAIISSSTSSNGHFSETKNVETPRFQKRRLAKSVLTGSAFTASFQAQKDEQSWMNFVPWTKLFSLQTEDGFWKLTSELGFILNLNTNILNSFLEQKGIRSLGIKGSERLLDLIATFLVLQFLRTKLEQKGIVFKSLMKLDDASISRNIPWAFEEIKKASEWVRRTEGQYPSICQRLELGQDWDSATKQLLGIQTIDTTSPLHRVLNYNQG